MVLNDLVRGGQSEARAVTVTIAVFGREKGIENAVKMFRGDTAAVIFDLQAHPLDDVDGRKQLSSNADQPSSPLYGI